MPRSLRGENVSRRTQRENCYVLRIKKKFMNLLRLYHTVKYLKPIQIKYQLKYRLKPLHTDLKIFKEEVEKLKINNLKFIPYISKRESYKSNNTFEFLNITKTFEENNINWKENSFGKLWSYNLNYMDYLLQSSMTKETGLKLIDTFVNSIPENVTGLEPYPTSLRGINWIKFVSKYNIKDGRVNRSLFLQYKLLNKRIEYHLLGNHLLENAFSLLFGAFYFSDENLFKRAKKLLLKELNEQILEDGGHFELSPMYHQIILDRLLDSINLIQNNEVFSDQDGLQNALENKAALMLGWLRQMTFSNGDIPLFNDSIKGIAPSSEKLFDYAKRLNVIEKKQHLSESGYRKFIGINYECIVDVGKIGPDYIPGHAHADMFSLVLYVNGKPLIIDPGISTYEKNERRQLERSTKFHNTVSIGGKNQSDVWGGFRVGKRAKITLIKDEVFVVMAEHNGYNSTLHKRFLEFNPFGLIIKDILSKPSLAEVYLHFYPDRNIALKGKTIIIDDEYSITFMGAKDITLDVFDYPLGYNLYKESKKSIVTFTSKIHIIIRLYKN